MRKYDEARAEYEAASMSTNSRGASTKGSEFEKEIEEAKEASKSGRTNHKETVDIELCAVTLEAIGHIARRLSQFIPIGSGARSASVAS